MKYMYCTARCMKYDQDIHSEVRSLTLDRSPSTTHGGLDLPLPPTPLPHSPTPIRLQIESASAAAAAATTKLARKKTARQLNKALLKVRGGSSRGHSRPTGLVAILILTHWPY